MSSFGKGVFFSVTSCVVWGALPMYWKLLSAINSVHILAFRILFSLLLVSGILIIQKKLSWQGFYKDRRKCILLITASVVITASQGVYIWGVNQGYTVEASLGYYICPLISIVLGLLVFREKLKLLQALAFALACAGVVILTVLTGSPPWISLALAVSFACYGLLKKAIDISALESLWVENLVMSPVGLLLLFTSFGATPGAGQGASYVAGLPLATLMILLFCGAVSVLPLYLFTKGARLLPLSTLGFIHFISPTLTFLVGVFVFQEPFPHRNFIAFGCIWTACILYTISLKARPGKP